LAFVEDTPNLALLAVGDVERSVRRLCNAVRARDRLVWLHQRVLAREAGGEDLERPGRLVAGEGLERDVVAVLRRRRSVPRSVERDERAALVLLRELRSRVEHDVDRRPVRREGGDRRL